MDLTIDPRLLEEPEISFSASSINRETATSQYDARAQQLGISSTESVKGRPRHDQIPTELIDRILTTSLGGAKVIVIDLQSTSSLRSGLLAGLNDETKEDEVLIVQSVPRKDLQEVLRGRLLGCLDDTMSTRSQEQLLPIVVPVSV